MAESAQSILIAYDNLYSLSTGIVSVGNKDFVNCEKAEQVGREIKKSFDNTPITKCSLKRKKCNTTDFFSYQRQK